MNQIDFGKWFHSDSQNKLFYKIRNDSNYLHDYAYINSYLNGAECFIREIKLKDAQLTIPIERICWEYYNKSKELLSSKSEIIISNVKDYYFQFPKDIFILNTIDIKDIYCNKETNDIIIANHIIKFKIIINIEQEEGVSIFFNDK